MNLEGEILRLEGTQLTKRLDRLPLMDCLGATSILQIIMSPTSTLYNVIIEISRLKAIGIFLSPLLTDCQYTATHHWREPASTITLPLKEVALNLWAYSPPPLLTDCLAVTSEKKSILGEGST